MLKLGIIEEIENSFKEIKRVEKEQKESLIKSLKNFVHSKGFSLEDGDNLIFSKDDVLTKEDIPNGLGFRIQISSLIEKGKFVVIKTPDFKNYLLDRKYPLLDLSNVSMMKDLKE
jgi:hypothetical protein